MKILVAFSLYDYGVKSRGYSYEYYNIYLPICDILGSDSVIAFDFQTIFNEKGKHFMNQRLKEIVISDNIDMALFCLTTDEFDEETVNSLRKNCKTCVYFFDDPWRQTYVRHWINFFDYFSTPDYYMYQKYKSENIQNVIFSPFGYNKNVYRKKDIPYKFDVSFVGGYSPLRKWILKELYTQGIKVSVFGRGWKTEGSWASQEQMVDIFNQSKINLNLSNGICHDIRFLIWALNKPRDIRNILKTHKVKEQVKGRHYEICGCGGFQLSYFIPGLNIAYSIDKEIAIYENEHAIAEQVKFYLKNDSLRTEMALLAHKNSVENHTSQKYLEQLIKSVFNEH